MVSGGSLAVDLGSGQQQLGAGGGPQLGRDAALRLGVAGSWDGG